MIQIARHRILCGDITNGAVAQLMGDDRADLVYSDPPWGPGNQKYWHTIRERGAAPRTSWPDFLAAFCTAVAAFRRPNAPVFVEMGVRWEQDLLAAMAVAGLPHRWTQSVLYGSPKRPNLLMLFGAYVDVDVAGMSGEAMTHKALAACVRPGHVVLDPCTGLGMTARVTHALSGVFRGCEMNAARLGKTEAWLRRHEERAHA